MLAGSLIGDQLAGQAFTASFPVTVTANVNESLSCGLSTGEISFGTVTSNGTRYATPDSGSDAEVSAHTLQVATNAQAGYLVSIVGPTPTANGHAINPIGAIPLGPTPGSEQYGLRSTAEGGSGSVYYPFNTSQYAYHANESAQLFAQAPAPSGTTNYTVYYMSNVSPDTVAGTYVAEEIYSCNAAF